MHPVTAASAVGERHSLVQPARIGSIALAVLSGLTFAPPVGGAESGAESNAAATQHEAQFLAGLGYGWGRHDGINPFRRGLFLHAGYTAVSGAYVGIAAEAYTGDRSEQADGHTDIAMVGFGAEIGYDLRLSERWAVRFALLNAASALEALQCRQLQPPPNQETCLEPEYSWRYGIGPSILALYLWENALFFSELRQTSYLSSSGAILSGTAAVGFGVHF